MCNCFWHVQFKRFKMNYPGPSSCFSVFLVMSLILWRMFNTLFGICETDWSESTFAVGLVSNYDFVPMCSKLWVFSYRKWWTSLVLYFAPIFTNWKNDYRNSQISLCRYFLFLYTAIIETCTDHFVINNPVLYYSLYLAIWLSLLWSFHSHFDLFFMKVFSKTRSKIHPRHISLIPIFDVFDVMCQSWDKHFE